MSQKAILSALLGVVSIGLLLTVLTGLPALYLGFLGIREINESDGRLRGRSLAVVGMVTGALGSLLFVVGIVALILLNLRENAARVMCANNLAQIGMALNRYYDKHDVYPAATLPALNLPPEKRLSWMVAILPYMEPERSGEKGRPTASQELFDQFDKKAAWDSDVNRIVAGARVRWCRCPNDDRKPEARQPGLTDYVGIAGVGKDAATRPARDANAGFFGYDRTLTRVDITGGISNTMVAAETTRDNGPWSAGGPATVRGVDAQSQPYIGAGRPFGGLHPRGTQVLFVDISVRYVRDDIKPETFEQLATIRGDPEAKGK